MKNYQDRLKIELQDLETKYKKLNTYIKKHHSTDELLLKQRRIMYQYIEVLKQRISLL